MTATCVIDIQLPTGKYGRVVINSNVFLRIKLRTYCAGFGRFHRV